MHLLRQVLGQMKTTSNVIDFQRWKEKKAIDEVFGKGFVDSIMPDYDTITYSVVIDDEKYMITVSTEEFFDPN
jgi:hypothetical protein